MSCAGELVPISIVADGSGCNSKGPNCVPAAAAASSNRCMVRESLFSGFDRDARCVNLLI